MKRLCPYPVQIWKCPFCTGLQETLSRNVAWKYSEKYPHFEQDVLRQIYYPLTCERFLIVNIWPNIYRPIQVYCI